MGKEEMMKRVVIGILCVGLVLLSASFAGASLKVSVNAGYYDPDYGQINEELSVLSAGTGMNLGFDSGFIYGLSIAGEIGDRLEARLEYDSFSSKTSGEFTDSYVDLDEVTHTFKNSMKMELTVSPVILSLVYRFPGASLSPHVGVGLGLFSTKLTGESWYREYEDGDLVDFSYDRGAYDDDPVGFLVLAGLTKNIGKNFVLRGEVRYIFSAKATFTDETVSPPWSVDCDLGGFMGNVGVECRF